MSRTPPVCYVVVLTLCTYLSGAQIIFSNQDAYVVSETTVYEIVKKVLLSNFASIDEKIRTLSVQNQQSSSGSYANILNLNERVSNLEDEIQTLKENMSSKRNSEIELIERRTQNCSRHVENLESRITTTFQKTKLLMEDSDILKSKEIARVSKFLSNFTNVLDSLDLKIDLIQNSYQNLSQGMTNFESRMNKTLHETGLQMNKSYSKIDDKIKNMSVTMEMLTNEKLVNMSATMTTSHLSLDAKIQDIFKNVSVSELKMQQNFNISLQEVQRELSNYTGHIQRTITDALNESVWLTEKRQQSLTEKLSSTFINVTKVLDKTGERFHQENSKINATMHKLEDNITKLTEKVFISNLEMSSLKQNMSKRIDDAFILINHSFIIETRNIRDNTETVVGKCENMTKQLEIFVDEKVISSVDNLTKSLNKTNIEIELQGSKMLRSIGILDEQVQSLQTENSNLLANVAETRNELSELRRNETMGTINLHSRISELELNISSLANKTESDVKQLVARMHSTLHETGLQINKSYSKMGDKITNMSATMEMMEIAINESEAKIECMQKEQQKLNENIQDIELGVSTGFQDTRSQLNLSKSLTNEKLNNMSAIMRTLQISLDIKIQDIFKNVSVSELKMQKDVNIGLQEVRREFFNYTGHIQRTLKESLNESVWMTEKRQQSLTEKLSSTLKNITKMLDNTKERFYQEDLKINATMHKLEDNITKLTDKVIKSKLEMSSLDKNMSKRIDDAFILLNHSFIIETTNIRDNIDTFGGKCENMTKALEIFVSEKVLSSVDNISKTLNQTNIQMESQGFKIFRSIGILDGQIQTLQTEKSNLSRNVAETRNELLELRRNETIGTKILHSRIKELALNISSLANETQMDAKQLTARMNTALHETELQINKSYFKMGDMITNMSERFHQVNSKINATMHKLEDNITKLTEKVIKSDLEMFSLKQNMSKRIDDAFILLNHSFIIETIDIRDDIETVGEKCENMTKQLEIFVDEKVISFVDNLTTSLNKTNIQVELQGSKMFRSIGILDEQVQTLQTEKSNLLANVAETRNELSELRRNETMGIINLHSQISALALNISSLANETQIDHKNLIARFSANLSGIESRFKNISQNLSLLFDKSKSQMEFQMKFDRSLKDNQEMFLVYKRDNELRISGTIQNCLEMNRQLEQSVHEEVIVSVINMTRNINMTNNRMHVQELKMNQSIGMIETKLKRMQSEKLILETNISDVSRVLSDVKRNNTFRFNKVHFQIMEIGSNMSSVKSTILTDIDDLTTKIIANVSETNIRVKDIVQNVSFLIHHSMSIEQTIAETVQKCVEMNKLLETTVDAKIVSSSVNLTKRINHTNIRTEVQVSLLNHSLGILNEQIKHLQTEKSNLVDNIAETKNELSELKKNETIYANNLNSRIKELTSNMSSVRSELQTKQSYLVLDIASNISRINDNYISLLNLSKQTNIITLHIQDLTKNLSSVEKELDVQFNLCKTNFGQHFQNQTEKFENELLKFNRTIEVKWSSVNETLFRKTRIVENDITRKNGQLSSRLDQFSGNINNMMRKVNTLESSNSGQNNRLSSIESRLSTVSSTLSNLRSDFNSHIPRVIRLVNGGRTYGRVEIFNNGAWGTVCDDGWDNNDARVVCRMLGLRGGTAKGSAYYGQGSGSIWLDDVSCSGSEQSIYTCTHPTIGSHNCNHGEDAGVICTSP